ETRNPAFNRMIDEIEQVAVRSKAPILLMGQTGAGKSFLARRINQWGQIQLVLSKLFPLINRV
ncbi:MAG: transcriptional regulator, partial [Methylomonas sp.]